MIISWSPWTPTLLHTLIHTDLHNRLMSPPASWVCCYCRSDPLSLTTTGSNAPPTDGLQNKPMEHKHRRPRVQAYSLCMRWLLTFLLLKNQSNQTQRDNKQLHSKWLQRYAKPEQRYGKQWQREKKHCRYKVTKCWRKFLNDCKDMRNDSEGCETTPKRWKLTTKRQ